MVHITSNLRTHVLFSADLLCRYIHTYVRMQSQSICGIAEKDLQFQLLSRFLMPFSSQLYGGGGGGGGVWLWGGGWGRVGWVDVVRGILGWFYMHVYTCIICARIFPYQCKGTYVHCQSVVKCSQLHMRAKCQRMEDPTIPLSMYFQSAALWTDAHTYVRMYIRTYCT